MSIRGGFQSEGRTKFGEAVDRMFPERQLVVRTEGRVSYLRFSPKLQIAFTAVFVMVGAWAVFTSVSFLLHDKVMQAKDNEIAGVRLAYHSLLDEVAEYQRKFTALTHDLEENHSLMLGLVEKNASLRKDLSSVSRQLEVTETERQDVIDNRENLKDKLSTLQSEMQGMASRNFSLKDNLTTTESDLQTALAERNKAQFEGTRMSRRINELETRLIELQTSEGEAIQRLTEKAIDQIESLEKVVEVAGLDVHSLVGAPKARSGQGGPFIPLKKDGLPAADLKANLTALDLHLDRLEALRDVMGRMPLTAPLRTYYITSSFGKRRDPITKRWSAHYGVDMGGRLKSSVYATAPGTVTFAGWKGRYGRLVEIDHGGGLKTRYGHLHRIHVKKGQKIKFQDKIAQLGNSGRSTGPHLHYEVVFNDKPVNPLKFIRAGRYVFKE